MGHPGSQQGTNRPTNKGRPRGARRQVAQNDVAARRFLLALSDHYGPDLTFSAASVLNLRFAQSPVTRRPYTTRVADSERALGDFFASELRRGEFLVLSAGRDGAGRSLWRVLLSGGMAI